MISRQSHFVFLHVVYPSIKMGLLLVREFREYFKQARLRETELSIPFRVCFAWTVNALWPRLRMALAPIEYL